MYKKFLVVFLLFYAYLFPVAVSALPTKPAVEAPSAMLLEIRRGQVLYAKNENEPLHISAASKLMTVYIAIEKIADGAMVIPSKEAVNAKGAMLDLTVGEKYSAESLIYASMLTNAPDATIALAEYVGGTIDGFVKLMNDYASSLNMQNTVFMNPTGEYDENQRTTASDLAKLLRHALTTSPGFEEVFSTQFKPWYGERTTLLMNLNDMFLNYEGVNGGKVDYTDPKFQTVITTATREYQQRLLCILLDSPVESMYADSMKLFDYGFDNFKWGILVSKGQPLRDNVPVEKHVISLVAANDVYYTYPIGSNIIQEMRCDPIETNLKLPLYKNTVVGTAKFTLVDGTIITVDLLPDREILPEMTAFEKLEKRLMEYKEIYYIIICLAAVEIIIIITKIIQRFSKHFSAIRRNRL